MVPPPFVLFLGAVWVIFTMIVPILNIRNPEKKNKWREYATIFLLGILPLLVAGFMFYKDVSSNNNRSSFHVASGPPRPPGPPGENLNTETTVPLLNGTQKQNV